MALQGACGAPACAKAVLMCFVLCAAREYETAHAMDLQMFFDSSLPCLRHPEVKRWGEALAQAREHSG